MPRPRPSARIQVPGPEYKVRQLLWWQIDAERPVLTAQLTYEVLNGRLFALPVTLPAGWEVEQVEPKEAKAQAQGGEAKGEGKGQKGDKGHKGDKGKGDKGDKGQKAAAEAPK